MAKGDQGWREEDQEQLHWFLLAAYIADAMGLLRPEVTAKLSSFESEIEHTWQESVRKAFDIDDEFVMGIHRVCRNRGKDEAQAIAFIMNGLGCPRTEDVVRDLSACIEGS